MAELPAIDRTLIGILVRGAEKIFDNAEMLYREGQILALAGAIPRALCLHQISLEECSKVENIGAWVTSLIAGHDVNQKRVLAAFSRHSSKNKSNAYMLELSQAEKDARERGDWPAAHEAFKRVQSEFHEASNDAKNASLYVDWLDGEFISPTEQITNEMLAEFIERNEKFLAIAHNSLKMLRRLNQEPEVLQALVIEFVQDAEKLRKEKPDDLLAATNSLVQRFLDSGVGKLKPM